MSIPATMKVVGSTDVGVLGEWEMPVPQPAPGDVLVKVAASGVNPIDFKAHTNVVPVGKERPYVLGCDLAGTVVAIGSDVKDFKVGDEVFGMTGSIAAGPQGTLAEYAIAWAPMLAKKPKNISMRQAAAFPLALLTAWEGMMDRVNIKPTDYVLVTGASGGVGHFCLQLAALKGAKVFGLASEGKRDIVERHGGVFVDYKMSKEELSKKLRSLTPEGRGFDVVYDALGGEWLDRAVELLAPHGFVADVGAFEAHNLAGSAMKGAMIALVFVLLPFTNPSPQTLGYYGRLMHEAAQLIEQGKLKVELDDASRFPFSKDGVTACYEALKSGKNRGKFVIDILPQ